MSKLAKKLKDADLAAKLLAGGYGNPRQIRDASNAELASVEGIGPAALKQIRKAFPKAR